MKRAQGSADVKLLECTNPVKDKWRVRWDVQQDENGSASYMEAEYDHKPAAAEILATIMAWYNQKTDRAILTGYSWDGTTVWLSAENQFNYKAAYDLAVQTDGASLPVTVKIGDDTAPRYVTFSDLPSLRDFYHGAVAHIQTTLAKGWEEKDAAAAMWTQEDT